MQKTLNKQRIIAAAALAVVIVLVFIFRQEAPSDIAVDAQPISTTQRTIQREPAQPPAELYGLGEAGRLSQPELPLDEEKTRAVALWLASEHHQQFVGEKPVIEQKYSETLGDYWEARFLGRHAFYQLWRPQSDDLVVTITAKTRVYDTKYDVSESDAESEQE